MTLRPPVRTSTSELGSNPRDLIATTPLNQHTVCSTGLMVRGLLKLSDADGTVSASCFSLRAARPAAIPLNFSEETFNSIVSSATLLKRNLRRHCLKCLRRRRRGAYNRMQVKSLPSGSPGLLVQEISRGAPETHACHLWQSRYQE